MRLIVHQKANPIRFCRLFISLYHSNIGAPLICLHLSGREGSHVADRTDYDCLRACGAFQGTEYDCRWWHHPQRWKDNIRYGYRPDRHLDIRCTARSHVGICFPSHNTLCVFYSFFGRMYPLWDIANCTSAEKLDEQFKIMG